MRVLGNRACRLSVIALGASTALVALLAVVPAASANVRPHGASAIAATGKALSGTPLTKTATFRRVAVSPNITVLYITSAGTVPGVHKCYSYGGPVPLEGVSCLDMYVTPSPGAVFVQPYIEGICHNTTTGGYYACPAIGYYANVNTGSGGHSAHDFMPCGNGYGTCFTPRTYWRGNDGITTTGCNPVAGSANEFWTVEWSGSWMEITTSDTAITNVNLGSQHIILCSGL
jgi:hypothetical protein